MGSMKTCRDCGLRKSVDDFYRYRRDGEGRHSRCKCCYQIRRRTRTPESLATERVERFWSYVDKQGPLHPGLRSHCWVWLRTSLPKGYGCTTWKGKRALAHRVSWLLTHGQWPKDCALHKCDNPSCVRPSHLFEGTLGDNNRDMVKKGRHKKIGVRGEDHCRAKLTVAQVRSIRELSATGIGQRKLAARFGVGKTTVSHILRRDSWAYLE